MKYTLCDFASFAWVLTSSVNKLVSDELSQAADLIVKPTLAPHLTVPGAPSLVPFLWRNLQCSVWISECPEWSDYFRSPAHLLSPLLKNNLFKYYFKLITLLFRKCVKFLIIFWKKVICLHWLTFKAFHNLTFPWCVLSTRFSLLLPHCPG